MSKMDKKRTNNFTSDEKIILSELVLKYRNVVENKRTDATSNADKLRGWEKLADQEDPDSVHDSCLQKMSHLLEELAVQLFDAGAVRLGDIEAKVGRRTPIYFDLRVVVSHPKIMMAVAQQLQQLAQEIEHDLLCGVPYAALPLAAVMSVNANTPMIMKRKETKLYATKKLLEGIYSENQECLVVEDVVTSGGSLLETVDTLRAEGLAVSHAVIVLEREQGGASVLKQNGVTVKSLFTLSGLVRILNKAGRIDDETVDVIIEHIKECQFGIMGRKDNLE